MQICVNLLKSFNPDSYREREILLHINFLRRFIQIKADQIRFYYSSNELKVTIKHLSLQSI